MTKRKYKRLVVTTTTEYLVPDYVYEQHEDKLDGVIKDWFEKYNINSYHATRDTCETGYSKKVIKVEKKGDL